MKSVIAWLQAFAATIGGPGLFIITFLDSSFLSLPQVNDLLVVTMVVQHPSRLIYYAAMATAGSVVGCLTLYVIGRRGGEALLRSRFGSGRVQRAIGTFQRYGLLAILVPALLPPPAPFKVFVLLGGVTRVPVAQFALAVAVGRGIRFFGIALLAAWYGQQAIDYIQRHSRMVGIVLAALVVAAGGAWLLWRRRALTPTEPNR
jgi:membrane protein YqaA with SNARE-associated domain